MIQRCDSEGEPKFTTIPAIEAGVVQDYAGFDGQRVLMYGSDTLMCADVKTGKQVWSLPMEYRPTWAANGLYASEDDQLKRLF